MIHLQAYNERLRKERLRALGNRAEDAALDGWRRLASGTAFVGYTKAGTPHFFGTY